MNQVQESLHHELIMETITPIPATLHKFIYYVKCPNRGNGNGKPHLGRTVKKCKVGCNSFRGFIDHQVLCAWGKPITVDPIINKPQRR